jgi:6-phosphogluconolactonase
MLPFTTFADRGALMSAAADRIESALHHGLAERGRACAALSGGASPEPAYRILAERPVDWRRVDFALVDERFVPPDDPVSNEGLLRRSLAPALRRGAALLPMFSPDTSLSAAAEVADAAYSRVRFDVALLGMGADGHTASWFAGAEGLSAAIDPASSRSVVALRAPHAAGSPYRISLTLAALRRAQRVLLLIVGHDKRERLEAARFESPEKQPVAALFTGVCPEPEILWAA